MTVASFIGFYFFMGKKVAQNTFPKSNITSHLQHFWVMSLYSKHQWDVQHLCLAWVYFILCFTVSFK